MMSTSSATTEVSSLDTSSLPDGDTKPHPEKVEVIGLDFDSNDNDGNNDNNHVPDGGLRAWLVVAGASLTLFSTFGFLISMGSLQDHWSQHQLSSYSSQEIGWISGLLFFLWLACGLVVGPVFDRYGPTWIMATGSIGFVAMMMLLAESSQFWHMILVCSVIGGASGAMLSTSALSCVSLWFEKKRGFSQGIAMAGSSLGGLVIPVILKEMFPRYGYAWSIRVLGFMTAACLVLGNMLVRGRNVAVPGTVPAAASSSSSSSLSTTTEKEDDDTRTHVVAVEKLVSFSIFKDLRVSLFTASVFGLEMVLFLCQVLLPSYASMQPSYPRDTSFYVLAVCNGASCLGRLGPGYVSDKLGHFNTLLVMIVFTLVFSAVLWLPFGHTSLGSLYAFSALFGFGTGSWMALIPACIGQLCPKGQFGRYYGGIYFIGGFATLISVPVGGELLDSIGPAAMVGFACAVLLISLIMFVLCRWAYMDRRWVLLEKA